MFVESRFILNNETKDLLHKKKAKFGYDGFGELVFYRTYSRKKKDNSQENWADCVIRVVEGTFSIRKDWYVKNHINWDEQYWQDYAINFAISMFDMKWLPPGRGLWAMGSDFIYERGSMALMNCAATEIGEQLAEDIGWLMDCLMLGVGVGFSPTRNDNLKVYSPCNYPKTIIITDDREGWVNSVELLIKSFLSPNQNILNFNYDEIRPEGCPISTFGGIASGPDPLKKLHDQIRYFFQCYMKDPEYDSVMLKTDIANSIGCCIVAGNIRRSAELGSLSIKDPIFKNLKDYDKYPYRKDWGWMSNNSVDLENDEDFLCLGEIAKSVVIRGEPGYKNLRNFPKGRIGKKDKIKKDEGRFVNPCLTGETKVCLADGRGFVRIDSLIDTDPLVYCVDEQDKIVIRKMRHVRKTGYNQKILKVIFDDGNFVRVTFNHKIMKKDKSFIEAQYLNPGDTVSIFNRYIPENSKNSYFDRYISIGYGGETYAEHKLIGKYKFGSINIDEEIHHKNNDRLNNNLDNLEIKKEVEHQFQHSLGSNNPNYSGFTCKDLVEFGITLAKKLNRRFSINEWRQQGLCSINSEFRKSVFGSFLDFSYMCADLAGVKNDQLDSRILKTYNQMIEQGYEVRIENERVEVLKICEACNNEFWISQDRREQAVCSMGCINTIRDYSKNIEGQRKAFALRREILQEQQLNIFCELKNKLNRDPLRKEWKEACEKNNISSEICRVGSPFKKWSDLKYFAKGNNHKIVSILIDGVEDVYNGTVDDYHNFIIGGWQEKTVFGRTVERGIFTPQCGEQILCSKELCTLSETCPTMCSSSEEWLQACEYATFYASTITLLPTHRPETNKVMAKNRRIGVGIIDFIGWKQKEGVHKIINLLRKGYKKVRKVNRLLAEEAGIPESIRVTTMKPGGTTPKLPGITAGMMHPNFNYMIRRIRIQRFSPIHSILADANIPYEEDQVSANTDVFEYPTYDPNKTADKISLWEQAMNLVLLQREWSDNAVSNTLNFKPKWSLIKHLFNSNNQLELELRQYMPVDEIKDFLHYGMEHYSGEFKIVYDGESGLKIYEYNKDHEEDDIEPVLSMIAPLTKSVSLLPHTTKGVYAQMPEEGITKEEYELRKSKIKIIDWSYFSGSDGMDEKYCTGPACEIVTN